VAFGLYAVVPLEDRSDIVPDVLRTAATAVWFGPAMILLSNFSLASLVPRWCWWSTLRGCSMRNGGRWKRHATGGGGRSATRVFTAREPGAFADCQLPRTFVWRERLPALAVALCLEGGAVSVAAPLSSIGRGLAMCAGTALLTVFSMATGAAGRRSAANPAQVHCGNSGDHRSGVPDDARRRTRFAGRRVCRRR
jgi:hypothetical protein